jgi:hypothetical protein
MVNNRANVAADDLKIRLVNISDTRLTLALGQSFAGRSAASYDGKQRTEFSRPHAGTASNVQAEIGRFERREMVPIIEEDF